MKQASHIGPGLYYICPGLQETLNILRLRSKDPPEQSVISCCTASVLFSVDVLICTNYFARYLWSGPQVSNDGLKPQSPQDKPVHNLKVDVRTYLDHILTSRVEWLTLVSPPDVQHDYHQHFTFCLQIAVYLCGVQIALNLSCKQILGSSCHAHHAVQDWEYSI